MQSATSKFKVVDLTGEVEESYHETQDQAIAWKMHITEWHPNARPVVEPVEPDWRLPQPEPVEKLAQEMFYQIMPKGVPWDEHVFLLQQIYRKLAHWVLEREKGHYRLIGLNEAFKVGDLWIDTCTECIGSNNDRSTFRGFDKKSEPLVFRKL